MKGLFFNNEEETKICANCIYYEETGFCSKKKKESDARSRCRKFELDIMSKSAKRRHSPVKKSYNSSDFDI